MSTVWSPVRPLFALRPRERQAAVALLLRVTPAVTQEELARVFGVTQATISRDIATLCPGCRGALQHQHTT